MSTAAVRLGLIPGPAAGKHLGVSPATIRSWVHRGYLTPAAKTRDGSKVTSWYRAEDLWRCARARLNSRQLAQIADAWAEVDALLADLQAGCHSDD